MSLRYNNLELDPHTLPSLPDNDGIRIHDATITYLTANHVGRKDFDQGWKRLVGSADIVFHEELAWSQFAKATLVSIAKGSMRDANAFSSDKTSYAWQRLEAVAGTKVQQDFWDASAQDALDNDLCGLSSQYQQKYLEAEDILKQGQLPEAVTVMQAANTSLGQYDAIRDKIGIKKVTDFAEDRAGKTPSIIVFAGAAHIYQAITLAKSGDAKDKSVSVKSLLEDPFMPTTKTYGNYLQNETDSIDTMKSWLFNILILEARKRQAYRSATTIANDVNAIVKSMSEDEASGRLLELGN